MFEISGLKPVHGPFVAIPTNITLVYISYLYISSLSSHSQPSLGHFTQQERILLSVALSGNISYILMEANNNYIITLLVRDSTYRSWNTSF